MKFGPFNISLSGARAAVPTLGESDAVKSGRLVLPTGGEYYQLLPKLTPLQVRAWLYAWLQGDFTSGYDLTQVMLDTWPRLRKNTHELREAAASCYYRVNPDGLDGEEPTPQAVERADFARKMLKRFSAPQVGSDETNFRGFIYDAADALIMGVSCQELIWDQREDGFQFVRASAWVNPRRLGYTAAKKIGLRFGNGVMSNSNFGGSNLTNAVADDFPTDRFVLGQYRTCSGSATKYSLLRPLAFYWASMIWGRDWLLRNAEQFGQPWVDLEYDSSINPSDLAALKAGLLNHGASTMLAHQTGSSVKLIEAKISTGNNLQLELIDLADKFCDLVILGQTMTSDVGTKGALATAKVHQDVRRERIQQLSDWIGYDPGAQLLRAITQANYGDADERPVLKPDFSEPQDPLVMAQRDQILATFMPLPQSFVYQRHSVPEPEEGEPVVGGPTAAGASDQQSAVSDQPAEAKPPKTDTLEAMNDNHSKANGQFISGPLALGSDGLPKRMSAAQADELLTKGVGVTDDQGRGVQFGQRLKIHIEHHDLKDAIGRKEDLAWGVHTVVSGQSRDIVYKGQPQRQYVKLFTVEGGAKGFTTIVDSKDGEAFRIHQVPARKVFQAGFERQTDGQPSERAQQALYAAADRLSGYFEYNQHGEIVNFVEAAGSADRRPLTADRSTLAAALSADLAPFAAKYTTLLSRLSTALAMHDEPRQAEIEHLRPELEAMLADRKTMESAISGQQSAKVLEGLLSQTFFNSLAQAKAGKK